MYGFKTKNIPTLDPYQNGLNNAGGNINWYPRGYPGDGWLDGWLGRKFFFSPIDMEEPPQIK